MDQRRITCLSFVAIFVGVALAIGGGVMLGIGIHKANTKAPTCPTTTPPTTTHTPATNDLSHISELVRNGINPDNIKQNLRDFTQQPHQAGTPANKAVADSIVSKWTAAGLEDVHTVSYDVLLSYPDWNNPNHVTITDNLGSEVFKTKGISPDMIVIEGVQGGINPGLQWLAFSPNGTVTGDVVFAGHGTPRDFDTLNQTGIDVKGKIALIRYGGSFRGNKVRTAERRGAIAVILYSDPAEVAPDGTTDGDIFPNKVYMPTEGVQRGTIYNGDGDPLSPLYPSKPNLWKSRTIDEARASGELPGIPAIPVSYSTAMELFKRMTGPAAPASFKGALNSTYNLGPGLTGGMTTTITVNGHFETRTIQNVIGYIYGSEEPDRYVILGNHYDAWVYGSMDPNAGTAALAEVARSIRQIMTQTGWKPARTIMFANWDAEEYGTIGSTEFVDEFGSILSQRAVIYINMDCLKGNQTLYVQASPSLTDSVYAAAKAVTNPSKSEIAAHRPTAYDTWVVNYPDTNNKSLPFLAVPTGGSDQKSFLDFLGIPSVNFYWLDADKHHTYPLYHTYYETPFLNEHLVDTYNFSIHRALGQYWAELAIQYAGTGVIPYSLTPLAHQIQMYYINDLASAILSINSTYTQDGYQQLKYMAETAGKLYTATVVWDNTKPSESSSASSRSVANDKMINFERCFVNPRGTSDDNTARHVLYSVNSDDNYQGTVMQQVYSVIDKMSMTTDASTLTVLGKDLAQQISIVHYSLQCAINALAKFI